MEDNNRAEQPEKEPDEEADFVEKNKVNWKFLTFLILLAAVVLSTAYYLLVFRTRHLRRLDNMIETRNEIGTEVYEDDIELALGQVVFRVWKLKKDALLPAGNIHNLSNEYDLPGVFDVIKTTTFKAGETEITFENNIEIMHQNVLFSGKYIFIYENDSKLMVYDLDSDEYYSFEDFPENKETEIHRWRVRSAFISKEDYVPYKLPEELSIDEYRQSGFSEIDDNMILVGYSKKDSANFYPITALIYSYEVDSGKFSRVSELEPLSTECGIYCSVVPAIKSLNDGKFLTINSGGDGPSGWGIIKVWDPQTKSLTNVMEIGYGLNENDTYLGMIDKHIVAFTKKFVSDPYDEIIGENVIVLQVYKMDPQTLEKEILLDFTNDKTQYEHYSSGYSKDKKLLTIALKDNRTFAYYIEDNGKLKEVSESEYNSIKEASRFNTYFTEKRQVIEPAWPLSHTLIKHFNISIVDAEGREFHVFNTGNMRGPTDEILEDLCFPSPPLWDSAILGSDLFFAFDQCQGLTYDQAKTIGNTLGKIDLKTGEIFLSEIVDL